MLGQEVPRFLELFAVTGFAVCQPLLNVFSGSPQTFVREGASTRDVVVLAVVVAVLPASLLLALGLLTRLAGPVARRVVHASMIGAVTGTFVVQVLRVNWSWHGSAIWRVGALAGVVAAVAVWRLRVFRTFLHFAAIAPAVFVALFLTASPVSSIVWASPPALSPAEAPDVPILFVVLDELPTASLLDADGGVDAGLVPNLASLAEDATWYRNSTTVSPRTETAVPAILTGKRPTDEGAAPIASVYDESLFTWLGRSYEVNASEPFTDVCPASVCGSNDGFVRGGLRELLRQGRDVWVDRVQGLPLLPPGFGLQRDIRTDRVGPFNRFLAGFHPDGSRRLDFLHLVLPHNPWRLTPTGAAYRDRPDGWSLGSFSPQWLDPETARIARQRHLMQLQYADRLVGRVLDRLRRSGHYDETMIVLCADHGVSFRSGSAPRLLADDNVGDIAWAPLLIKPPGQTEGRIDERPAETIDILPTMADQLGTEIPWETDGRSLLGPVRRGSHRRILVPAKDLLEPEEDGSIPVEEHASYRRVVGTGPAVPGRGPLRLFQTGEYGALVGREAVPLIGPGEAPFDASIEDPVRQGEADDGILPLYVRAQVHHEEPVPVALVVNGSVAAWTRTHAGRDTNAWAVIPESLLRPGRNELSLYLIEGDADHPVLQAIPSD